MSLSTWKHFPKKAFQFYQEVEKDFMEHSLSPMEISHSYVLLNLPEVNALLFAIYALVKTDILKTYTLPWLIYIADHSEVKTGLLETLDQKIRTAVKEWLHLLPCTCDAILYSSTRDGVLGITKLAGLIPSVQARRLHRIAQSSDDMMKCFLEKDRIEQLHKKLWIQAGGDSKNIPSIWEAPPSSEPPNNVSTNLERIPHRKLLTALKLRANIYPTREFLARGRQDQYIKACRHCDADIESCAHIIGNCPVTQDARIKRHNYICKLLLKEEKKKDWVVFKELHIKDSSKELYKPDLIFVKDARALVVDVTVRYEAAKSSPEEAAAGKANKYKHLESEFTLTTLDRKSKLKSPKQDDTKGLVLDIE
ncbi:Retrovirus-related Pol polyprotein from type-1 retrotransposable element R2 [Lonchura striata]|uniref:Retrovirus-related Pol polyprotein from type-1 retrotransposable element R2 n=1 Tax=Lonchura striata TaxID=40157 RepID=A0A218VD01_9PASE|nr:Retrovirus-related Pol polyprotein from type-1 retrotransposable element R2 [Lonchura striata domestica]